MLASRILNLTRYLDATLGLRIAPKALRDVSDLPHFMLDRYDFYSASLLGKAVVLAVARESDAIPPAAIRKHVALIQEKLRVPCIYVSDSASYYNRKRLIAHRVQFVIINRQIYFPALGMDWVENYRERQKHRAVPKTVAPSTQIVLIYALTHQSEKKFIPLNLARVLNYTSMTMTRALNEIETLNLGKTIRKGKERRFEISTLIWEKVRSFLQSPVKKRIWLKTNKLGMQEIKRLGVLAGLSALSELTLLSKPPQPIYAVSKEGYKELCTSNGVEEIPSADDADIELEVWSYDPKLCAEKGYVDLFSLYLSLQEIQDERVEEALGKLMKDIQ